ncbi:cyclin-D3-3-like [Andrographis paniculata]|uniref:cyclin-D3-3-like n=1 Tax=Andrographis paniculata TaxID=175694 RepID=UPI0021E71A60|nr:cyclin-D3-3-like [Andrographis paniculata]
MAAAAAIASIDQNGQKAYPQPHTHLELELESSSSSFLYCNEEEEEMSKITSSCSSTEDDDDNGNAVVDDDDDEELKFLLKKEQQYHHQTQTQTQTKGKGIIRKQGVEWILRASCFHGFSPLTALLAVNYLDRLIDRDDLILITPSSSSSSSSPWMMQLAAVACLSLAAKLEEPHHAPLLQQLSKQEEDDSSFMAFKVSSIQRMELLVLRSLDWMMNPVTPLSFIHNILLPRQDCYSFLNSCQNLLLSLLPDARLRVYSASVMAAATMLHVIRRHRHNGDDEIENQLLLPLLQIINKEEVNLCYEAVSDILLLLSNSNSNGDDNGNGRNDDLIIQTHQESSSELGSSNSCNSSATY